METIPICKKHNKPISMYCISCKGFLCLKCTPLHSETKCKYPIDLISYATTELLPQCKAQVHSLDEKKNIVEITVQALVEASDGIRQMLIQLRNRLLKMVDTLNATIKSLTVSIDKSENIFDTVKQIFSTELEQLENSINNENLAYIMHKLTDREVFNVIATIDGEKEIVTIIEKTVKQLIDSNDLDVLRKALKLLNGSYKKIANRTSPKINSKFVYGICYKRLGFKQLCRYELDTRKLAMSAIVPRECTVTQINKYIFITGGYNPIINKCSEVFDTTKEIINKAPMKYSRYGHRAEPISVNEFIVMGGNNDTTTLSECEEYSIIDDEWKKIPSLNKPRYWHASVFMNERFLYVIGGCNTNREIELLDVEEKKVWISVPISVNELKYDACIAAFPISKSEIMILCGDGSFETGIFNIREKKIKMCDLSLRPDNYYYNPACTIENNVYIIGASYGHIRIYNIDEKKFDEIEYSAAFS